MNKHLFDLTGASIVLLLLAPLSGCQLNPPRKPPTQDWLNVAVSDDFEFDSPSPAWVFRSPANWRVAFEGDRRFLQMAIPPEGTRLNETLRPWEYAVYGKYEFRSFSMSCRVRIDRGLAAKDREACVLFGRQDPSRYYCIRLAADSSDGDPVVTCIDGKLRKKLTSSGNIRSLTVTDRGWHRLDVLRDADSGTIKISWTLTRAAPPLSPCLKVGIVPTSGVRSPSAHSSTTPASPDWPFRDRLADRSPPQF